MSRLRRRAIPGALISGENKNLDTISGNFLGSFYQIMLKRPRLCPTIPAVGPVRIEHNKFCRGEFPPFVYFQTIFRKHLRLFRKIRGFTPGKLLFDLRHELKQKREYDRERKAKSRQLRKTLHQNQ